ncbi:response regulator transcription factor [Zestomonas thermotolerans]|uniref:response regulator transcription factor n=1 Tax=Zestomonas thermotolerans TaxID=157784 RepID=UPI0023EFE5B2|nr:LuxR C-terminal-related transcriptional regulator [Pseudomonas thermotolerans]MBO2509520.1 hypothetical protein [Gammaproteobacteria bacterium]
MIRYADARQRWAHVNPALGHYLATRLSRFNPRRYRELRHFVARWLAEGLTNKEIAQRLSISEGTVKGHRKRIHEKLGVTSRSQAISRARELLLI